MYKYIKFIIITVSLYIFSVHFGKISFIYFDYKQSFFVFFEHLSLSKKVELESVLCTKCINKTNKFIVFYDNRSFIY